MVWIWMEGISPLKEPSLKVQAGTMMGIEIIVVVAVIVTATVVTMAVVVTVVVILVEVVVAAAIASNVASLAILRGNALLMMVAGGTGTVAGMTGMVEIMAAAAMGLIVVVIVILGAVMEEAAMVGAVIDTTVTSLVLMNVPAEMDTDLDGGRLSLRYGSYLCF